MIVLHEHGIDAGVGELSRLPGLHEKPAESPNTCGSMTNTPSIGVSTNFISTASASWLSALFHDAHEIFAVSALRERLRKLEQLFGIDES